MVKKTKKAKTKSKKPVAMKHKGPKTKKGSVRDKKIAERMQVTGNFQAALDEMLAINLEIDATSSAVPLRFGETAARMRAAKLAFEDAILQSDDLKDWVKAARSAARLP